MTLRIDVEVERDGFRLAVEFEARAGIVALFGANGSGKSTLLHAIAGLVRARRGHIAVGDRVLLDSARGVDVPVRARRVGVVFQDLRLFPHLRVGNNVLYGAATERPAFLDYSEPILDALGLRPLWGRRPADLSGGERQRVALGRALLSMPDVVLMDEPLASVDVALRRQILPCLRWVHERYGVRVVYVSHSLAEILELTDEIVVLDGGRVCAHGEVFDVLGRTPHATVALSTESLVPVDVEHPDEEGGHFRARIGQQRVLLPFARILPGSRAKVAVRPEDVMIARERLRRVSARNQLHGTVERITALHGRELVHVRVGPDAVLRAELTREAVLDLEIEVGCEVFCVVKTSAFQWA